MANLPHTLDNLSKKEKEKVVDMLKQLNELKKRCTALEQQLESKQMENERLAGREDVMTKHLEATESKLFEAIELSKESQAEFEQLSLKLQKSEAVKKSLNGRLRNTQAEIQTLKEGIRDMKLKHEKILVNSSVQCRIICCDKSSNTEDTAIDLSHAAIQVPAESSFAQPTEIKISHMPQPSQLSVQESQVTSQERSASAIEQAPVDYQTEADEDLSQLICMLNQL